MTVIHLAFDVDGDVYPELHAMLSAIGSEAARAERFRQLAANGLVWESVRIGGQPVLPSPQPAAQDCVDLAIDVVSAPAHPADELKATMSFERAFDRAVEQAAEIAARQLPVLLDVVEPEAPVRPHAATRSRLQRMKAKGLFKNG